AAANLAHAFAKFGFSSPALPQDSSNQASEIRGSMPVTDVVFDAVAEELPRLLAEPNAQSTVLLCHSVARAGQHRRRPALPAAL
ncbi:RGLG2, partial [Symbiodinium sp. KB8]